MRARRRSKHRGLQSRKGRRSAPTVNGCSRAIARSGSRLRRSTMAKRRGSVSVCRSASTTSSCAMSRSACRRRRPVRVHGRPRRVWPLFGLRRVRGLVELALLLARHRLVRREPRLDRDRARPSIRVVRDHRPNERGNHHVRDVPNLCRASARLRSAARAVALLVCAHLSRSGSPRAERDGAHQRDQTVGVRHQRVTLCTAAHPRRSALLRRARPAGLAGSRS